MVYIHHIFSNGLFQLFGGRKLNILVSFERGDSVLSYSSGLKKLPCKKFHRIEDPYGRAPFLSFKTLVYPIFQNIIHPTSLLRIKSRSEILKCKVCQNTSSPSASCRLHACLHCVYIACYEYSHIKTHLRKSNHPLAIDVSI